MLSPPFGDFAEAHEEEAGEGFYATFSGEFPLHLGLEVAEVNAALEEQGSGGGGEDGPGGVVEFVVELAGELLDGVFYGDEADG